MKKRTIFKSSEDERIILISNVVQDPDGVLVIIHGWFGSVLSSNVIEAAEYFQKRNWSVVRVGLKDHGNTEHLNSSLFSFTDIAYIQEVLDCVAELYSKRMFLLGFSFGGNIIIRLLRECSGSFMKTVAGAAVVSPVLNPLDAFDNINTTILYKWHLLSLWKKSLRKRNWHFHKRTIFPNA